MCVCNFEVQPVTSPGGDKIADGAHLKPLGLDCDRFWDIVNTVRGDRSIVTEHCATYRLAFVYFLNSHRAEQFRRCFSFCMPGVHDRMSAWLCAPVHGLEVNVSDT